MLTGNRLRERKRLQPARAANAPVPAIMPDPVEQSEKIRQLEVELGILRGQLVAMERRAVNSEAREAASHAELMKLTSKPQEAAATHQTSRGKR